LLFQFWGIFSLYFNFWVFLVGIVFFGNFNCNYNFAFYSTFVSFHGMGAMGANFLRAEINGSAHL